ncbi:MAG: PEP-CTERM sorting domain-containing protein [Okeania sp. SIO3I5]|uniref:PEP-CTERM sorting domain-containing protein n=1 Tax=Okeania sp. SIO3I5 TaxID=2607805 RepID=UPI0013B6AE3B|nr:PEP-CTERM sorting domain-containing protein [Okeania sp. SIO3I5]
MLKKTLFVVASTIAVTAATSLPAAANLKCPPNIPSGVIPGCSSAPVKVPEPTTVLGLLCVGGGMVAKKMVDSRMASK